MFSFGDKSTACILRVALSRTVRAPSTSESRVYFTLESLSRLRVECKAGDLCNLQVVCEF